MTALDTSFVRAQFPAFATADFAEAAFFDNAGGTFACRQVIDRLTRFYRERKVQPYAAYAASTRGGAEMDEARSRLAAMMDVGADEVVFGPSTTQNTYVLAQAFAEQLAAGDAIVVTDQDHEANSGAWRRLALRGIEVREWRIDAGTGHLDPAGLADLLDDRVRLVCFSHCSNVVAEINDVAAISALAHGAGAVVCVDGVSYAPHGLPDVDALGADIYLFSTYKTYGPHQGVMVVRRALAHALPNQGHAFNAGFPDKRLAPAGADHAQVAACAGIADYVDALHAHHFAANDNPRDRAAAVHGLMRSAETALLQPLLDFLAARNDLRLLGPAEAARRAPTVALALARPGADAARDLAAHGILCDGGDFYAPRPLAAQGVDPDLGVLRVSFVHYTTAAEVDRLITALDRVL